MDVLTQIPAIVKVLIALAIVLTLNRLSGKLWVSLIAGAGVLAALGGHGPGSACRVAVARVLSGSNLGMMSVVFLVIWLSSQMKETGVMDDLVTAVRSRLSRRLSMAVLPAVIGFLPMPGGALFSAPLVDGCDHIGDVEGEIKTRVNYWFRHVWEYWWPLYPGVLLTLELTGLEVWQFILLQFPLSLFAMLGGYLFLLRRISTEDDQGGHLLDLISGRFLTLVTPILVVISVYAALRVGLPVVSAWNRYLPMSLGIVAAMGVLQLQRPLKRDAWRRLLITKRVVTLAALVALVRVYGAFTELPAAGGATVAEQMQGELDAWGIPVVLVVMIVPFISGVASGLAVGFVGTSFPIVVSLAQGSESPGTRLAMYVLAYGTGYMGMMLSPVHVCLIVTNEHFRTSLNRSLAGLLPPAGVTIGGTLLLHMALRMVLP